MMEDASTTQPKTFKENWKTLNRAIKKFERRFVPPVSMFASCMALLGALLCFVTDRIDMAIFMVLVAGFALALAVSIPVLTRERNTE
ncbi:MAG: hypothetical protein F4X44_13135 [Gammaproteobacteria bacterium]|nr:hypothetical protein [Gammaproteobacteria bacterium]MYD81540.1 hypothetical protein [Gammaproteobacteria bacterium]